MLLSRFAISAGFCFLTLFSLHSLPAKAGQVIAVGAEFAHIFERNVDGDYVGLGVDLIRSLAKQNGDTVSFEIYPWRRAQWMVENGHAHILIGPYKTAERETKFVFAQKPFFQDIMAFYVRQGSPPVIWDGSYASLHGSKVAVINGWVYGPQFEAVRSSLNVEVANSLENGLNMLVAKRVDYLATNLRNSDALLNKMGLASKVVTLQPFIDRQDGYLAYCKQACDMLRSRYDESYEQLRVSNALQELAHKFEVRLP
ncbi:substrate-binding periplasmic protein [Undibacterium sp. SXout20W]|uniref:substrate-binding periplasmic protein n=1 Tax=Undibacterium sp. SXout20W TaxID=3413051 RepID=UPI003BF42A5B